MTPDSMAVIGGPVDPMTAITTAVLLGVLFLAACIGRQAWKSRRDRC